MKFCWFAIFSGGSVWKIFRMMGRRVWILCSGEMRFLIGFIVTCLSGILVGILVCFLSGFCDHC
jgi:hypothetical protein